MLTLSELEAEWSGALQHAGFAPDRARLYPFDTPEAAAGHNAVWFRPGDVLVADDQFPDAGRLADANAEAHRSLHRVAVWRRFDVALTGALLRHELQHARQWEDHGASLFDLQRLIEDSLSYRAGGLKGCAGALINAVPTELDCNAAASAYLRAHHPDAMDAVRAGPQQQLACSLTGPPPSDSLPARMIAFAFVHAEQLRALAAARGSQVDDLLNGCYRWASDLWKTLDAAALEAVQR